MADRVIDITQLEIALQQFADERDWQKFHSPKNLAMALTGEVGELVEIFQWLTEEESRQVMDNPKLATSIRDEIADVLIYLVRMATILHIDVDAVVRDKIARNAIRFPRVRP